MDVTFSEDAITDIVVKDHQETAGIADADALRAVPVEKELFTETIEMTTDVVVVGGGAAGMAATVRLEQLGKNVILLEKASFLGGVISVSGACQVVMGSKL